MDWRSQRCLNVNFPQIYRSNEIPILTPPVFFKINKFILNHVRIEDLEYLKQSCKIKTKLKDLHYLNLRFTIKLQ